MAKGYAAYLEEKDASIKEYVLRSSFGIIDAPRERLIFETLDQELYASVLDILSGADREYKDRVRQLKMQLQTAQTEYKNKLIKNLSLLADEHNEIAEYIATHFQTPQQAGSILDMGLENERILEESEELIYEGIDLIKKGDNKRGLFLISEALKRYEQILSIFNASSRELAQMISSLYMAIMDNQDRFFKVCSHDSFIEGVFKDLRTWREYMKTHPFTLDTTHKIHEPTMSAIFQVIQQLDPTMSAFEEEQDVFF